MSRKVPRAFEASVRGWRRVDNRAAFRGYFREELLRLQSRTCCRLDLLVFAE